MAEHIQGYNDNTPAYVEFNALYITSVIGKSCYAFAKQLGRSLGNP